MIGTNATSTTPGSAYTANTHTDYTQPGPVESNPFVFTSLYQFPYADSTPTIPELQGGAATFGLANSSQVTSILNDANVSRAISNAPTGALVAVVRVHAPSGLGALGTSSESFDYVLYINLTSYTLTAPTLALGSVALYSAVHPGLELGGPAFDPYYNRSSTGDPTIQGLAGGSIWVTMMPATNDVYVNATLGGPSSLALVDSDLLLNSALYITDVESAAPSGAGTPITGLQVGLPGNDGSSLYALNTAGNLLITANQSDLTERQSINLGSGALPTSLAESGTSYLYVGESDSRIATYSLDSGGNVTASSLTTKGTADPVVAMALTSGGILDVAEKGAIEKFTVNTSNGTLSGASKSTATAVASLVGLATSSHESWTFGISSANNTVVLINPTSLAVTQGPSAVPSTSTATGTSAIAVSPDGAYVYVVSGASASLAVFSYASNALTLAAPIAQDGVNGARGLAGADGVSVSTDDKYIYVTSSTQNSLAIYELVNGQLVLDQVLRGSQGLTDPTGVSVNASNKVFVTSGLGSGLNNGGLASFALQTPGTATPHNTAVTFSGMSTINVNTGSGDDTINEIAPPTDTVVPVTSQTGTVTTLGINAGAGSNTVDIERFSGTTTVTTGAGSDQVTIGNAASSGTITVNTGTGNDTVELDGAAANTSYTVNTGGGTDKVQVEGTQVAPTSTVHINGGSGGSDNTTLVFDASSNPIVAYDASNNVIATGQPATPNGAIQVSGTGYGKVNYTHVQNIPGFVGAVVSANTGSSPYTITQGNALTLAGGATPATGSTILGEQWDLNGDGVFGDASGLTPTVSWVALEALGLTHAVVNAPVALRVVSNSGTVTSYSTLTINAAPPSVTLSAVVGTSNPTVGVPFTVNFSGTEVGSDPITGYKITWGDGKTDYLPSDATSDTHTYTAAVGTSEPISASAQDVNFPNYYNSGTSRDNLTVKLQAGAATITSGGPYTITAGLPLTLTATSSAQVTSFTWDINGDGNFNDATSSTPVLVNGLYTSTATVSWLSLQTLLTHSGVVNDGPQTLSNVAVKAAFTNGTTQKSALTSLTIQDAPPTAALGVPSANQGASVTASLTGASDVSQAVTRSGFTYAFDLANDGVFTTPNSVASIALPATMTAHAGSYVISGRVYDASNNFTTYSATLGVSDVAPLVHAGTNLTINSGGTAALAGVTFSDPGYDTPGFPETYSAKINWGDNTSSVGQISLTEGAAGSPTTGTVSGSHVYAYNPANPSPTVTATVYDVNGMSGSATFTVTVRPPTVAVTNSGAVTITEGGLADLTGIHFTDSSAPTTHTAVINWEDNSPAQTLTGTAIGEPAGVNDLGTLIASHYLGQPGTYNVAISVTDSLGVIGTTTLPVTVVNANPTVIPGPDLQGGLGVNVGLNSSFTDPGFPVGATSETYSAHVDWGDQTSTDLTLNPTAGSPGTPTAGNIAANHIYGTEGDHTVHITVTDSLGGSDTKTLVVHDPVPTITAAAAPAGNEGSPVSLSGFTFSDPGFSYNGVTESFQANVQWGDGSSSPATLNVTQGHQGTPTTGTISASHAYSIFGSYPVEIDLNGGGGMTTLKTTATIQDVAPVVGPLPGGTIVAGQEFDVTDTFTDAGLGDTHTATLNFGDGTTIEVDDTTTYIAQDGSTQHALIEPTATSPGLVRFAHVYKSSAPETISLTVADNGGLSTTVYRSYSGLTVSAASPSTYGQAVSFTATRGSDGGVVPAGSIQFQIDGTNFGQPINLLNGSATSPSISTLAAGPHMITALYSGDGTYPAASASVSQVVNKAILTVAANNASSTYGGPIPSLSDMITGFVNNEDASVISGAPVLATSATSQSPAGMYPITVDVSQMTAANYTFAAASGSLTINKAVLTVTATDQLMAHGDPVPSLSYTVSGFVNNDGASVVSGSPTLSTSATSSSAAGSYAITAALGTLSAVNYSFALANGTLRVEPKVVDVRVQWGNESMSILNLNRDLPFSTITAIDVIFSDNVVINASDASLTGSVTKSYNLSNMTYSPATDQATFNLPSAIAIDRLMLSLDNNVLSATDASIKLAPFAPLNFAVLPGDFNGDGVVTSLDLSQETSATIAPYNVWADINGDGSVDLNDVKIVRSKSGTKLPPQ